MPKIAFPWQKTTITLTVVQETRPGVRLEKEEKIPAKVLGPLAVYQRKDGDKVRYSVSLVEADSLLVSLPTEKDAVAVAEALYLRLRSKLTGKDLDEIRGAFSPALREWLRECQAKGSALHCPQ